MDVVRIDAITVLARRFDQPFVHRRIEVIQVRIAVEIVGDYTFRLEVDEVDVGKGARRLDDVALELESDVELAALRKIDPDQDRIGRPHDVEFGLRVTAKQRQKIVLETSTHALDRALWLPIPRVEMREVDIDDALPKARVRRIERVKLHANLSILGRLVVALAHSRTLAAA